MSIAVLEESGPKGKARYHLKLHNTVFEIDEKFVIGKAIGYSSHGVLVSANNTATDEKVAIEKIKDLFKDLQEARHVVKELQLLRCLKHPNILGIKDIFEPAEKEFNDLYVVNDLMSWDLREMQRTPRLTIKHAQLFAYQLMCALKHMHSAHVVHSDLRPSTILVDEEANLKLAKFGLAHIGGEQVRQDYYNNLAQPYWYLSPEVLARNGQITGAADVWSAGAVLAEMLRQKPVITGRTIEEVQASISDLGTLIPTLLKDAPAAALDLVKKLLVADPVQRLTAAQALDHPWLAEVRDEVADIPGIKPLTTDSGAVATTQPDEIRRQIIEEIKEYHPNY